MIENFDKQYRYAGDRFDKKTKVKVKGFYDQEQVDEWRRTMEGVFKRRLKKKKQQIVVKTKVW